MSEQGISPVGVSELQKREELRRFAKLGEIPEAKDIYRFLSIIVDSVKKIRLSASTSGRDGGFARLTQLQEIAE